VSGEWSVVSGLAKFKKSEHSQAYGNRICLKDRKPTHN